MWTMIKNDQRDVLSFGTSMGCYLSLALVYMEVDCEVVHLSKKDNDLSMNSYMLSYDFGIHDILMYLSLMILSIVD